MTLSLALLLVLSLALQAAPIPFDHANTAAARATALVRSVQPSGLGPTARPSVEAHPTVVSGPSWLNVTRSNSGASPPVLYGASVAYDPVEHATVLFGGCLASACPSNQTWVFARGVWTDVTRSSDTPPARDDASVDFDANMGGLLLFGGSGAGGALLNDTWLYRGGVWTNLSYVGGGPSPRFAAAMAFDPAPEENGSVLYGGCVPATLGVSCSNDTWVWQGWSGWVPLAPSQLPPAVGYAGLAYDPVDDYVVLFGGCSGTFCAGFNNQTWLLYSGQWWPLHTATSPDARSGAAVAWDPALGAVLLFGGTNSSLVDEGDTWSFEAGTWHRLAPSAVPSARADAGMALDPSGNVPILVGGIGGSGDLNDTWAFELPLTAAISAAPGVHETNVPVSLTATVAGGSGTYGVAATFGDGDGTWVGGTGPTFAMRATYSIAGDYVPSVNVTDSTGAVAPASGSPFRVTAGPSIVATATPSQVDLGIPVHFAAVDSSSGTPPFTVSWSYGDGTTGSGASTTYGYSGPHDVPGIFTVDANLTDGAGGTASSTIHVVVAPLPTVKIAVATIAPNTSAPVVLDALTAGGTGPFTYAWSFGDGGRSALPSPDHQFANAGTYTVVLWANDSVGASAHATETFTVETGTGPSTSTPTSSAAAGAPLWFWAGIGGLALVAVVGSILLARRPRTA